ncbi:MAG TPA: Flp family type IVb pilin [bacterium]|jgi:pilus assembly protein Flp/PilA|nr:Flp family type IVb pilin [bacterium]HOY63723.1 Flp family type IVb pilin [bacterium]HPI77951.1 Flp family type IVb pilin [bacterium]HPN92950.1 Flp family type IVb pilin [bacterium]
MLALLKSLWSDERGQGLTEYALIIAFVSVVIIAVLVIFRGQIEAVFTSAGNELSNPH